MKGGQFHLNDFVHYIYTYTHTHTHKYTHTYTYRSQLACMPILNVAIYHIHIYIHSYAHINTLNCVETYNCCILLWAFMGQCAVVCITEFIFKMKRLRYSFIENHCFHIANKQAIEC